MEVRVRGVDGWRLTEVRGAPLGEDILVTLRDITERRRWQVAGDEVARFRALMQNGASITLLMDGAGDDSGVVGGRTRLLGHDQEVLEGQPLDCIVDGCDREVLSEVLEEVRPFATASVTVDLRLCCLDGRVVPFVVTFTNLLDDPTVRRDRRDRYDISDRVATEDELRETNSLLATTWNRLRTESWSSMSAARLRLQSQVCGHVADPDDILATATPTQALRWVLDQLCDPAAFLARAHELYATPEAHGP